MVGFLLFCFFYLEAKNLRTPLGFCVMSSWWSLDPGLREYCDVMVMGGKKRSTPHRRLCGMFVLGGPQEP